MACAAVMMAAILRRRWFVPLYRLRRLFGVASNFLSLIFLYLLPGILGFIRFCAFSFDCQALHRRCRLLMAGTFPDSSLSITIFWLGVYSQLKVYVYYECSLQILCCTARFHSKIKPAIPLLSSHILDGRNNMLKIHENVSLHERQLYKWQTFANTTDFVSFSSQINTHLPLEADDKGDESRRWDGRRRWPSCRDFGRRTVSMA